MLTNAECVEKIYLSGHLKTIIQKVGKAEQDLDDLEQDLYLALLKKDNKVLNHLIENENELKYYLAKMVTNQIKSKSSPYQTEYKRYHKKKSDEKPERYTNRLPDK